MSSGPKPDRRGRKGRDATSPGANRPRGADAGDAHPSRPVGDRASRHHRGQLGLGGSRDERRDEPGEALAGRVRPKLRCAVYTRKSSEEGLDMEFNSLDAQREACAAYIASQRNECWIPVRDDYDDGGVSGGTLERPALKRLLADIEAGLIDIVVVYKIDRLSRSLMDFARLVDVFDRMNVTFVSITQSFNTTTSMGRLTLNILLSFAQFEREVIGERIRDKFAASRKRGMWMGGNVPLGYVVRDRKLIIHEPDARIVTMIFERFASLGSATKLASQLVIEGVTTKSGKLVDKGFIYKLLNNRVYIGDAVHKGTAYPGEHSAIIARDLWDRVHGILAESPRTRGNRNRAQMPALLKGLIFGPNGRAMSPTHTRKCGKLYRYYVSQSAIKGSAADCPVGRIPAGEIEDAVIDQLRLLLRSPEIIVATWRKARGSIEGLTEDEVRVALQAFEPLWDQLFPAEQARIVQLLVERVDVDTNGADIRLKVDGLTGLISEMRAGDLAFDPGRKSAPAESAAAAKSAMKTRRAA